MSSADSADPAAQLIIRVAASDREAFAELYDLFAARVYGMALRVAGDRALAEDIAQETWLAVWKAARNFRPERGSAAGWLLSIAHRRAVDTVRSQEASRRRSDADARMAVVLHDDSGVEDSVVAEADRDIVRQCLAQLSDVQREALSLAYFGGLTHREIASRLQVGLPAVKSRVRDAVAAMRRCMGQ
ncbi:sigma-70 family RNA polymerase sigma factor [Corynebacterium sp. TAE3-ERU12]|uniref:sigma-70 family RNA polymerase sigma factor n=1 Tax=Corynebacterium sp. TAE3-ERU12 TaxID=2849491 RepID=UPI001C468779|nr:sigma-70 family RNA polymerase sigma factor [Corynebacterium sp. TAE3-ERU12]MBV7295790.1 sigma-70 family RNA polymerase sigma factor [Corynebacterium sp. TAE3-ERU12]